jgi:dinuclear metal center YbgI/SA1388 family protein
MVKIKEIANCIESIAPTALQQTDDNTGLLLGNPEADVAATLITLDVTEEVVDEAIQNNCGLIIAHHPLIYKGLKKLTGRNYVERTVIKAIKNDVAVYAAHTNIDAAKGGVSAKICEKLGLINTRVLQPVTGQLKKLVTFIPSEAVEKVRESVFNAGAGHIGNYDWCGYNIEGTGSFRGNEQTNPHVGEKGTVHYEKEIRFETIFPGWLQSKVLQALISAHPYEEVAYDIYSLDNALEYAGMGMVGELPVPVDELDFLKTLKQVFGSACIKHTELKGEKVSKVAVCGGVGSSLLKQAISVNADFFVSADFKYHQYFDAEGKIVIADVGHFESEQFTKELFYEVLVKNFPKFAVRISEVNTNPVFCF